MPYKDGIITSRDTFQKYYTQSELKLFIELSLDEQAFAVAPGIYFIFKEKILEQKFLQNRHKPTLPNNIASLASHPAIVELGSAMPWLSMAAPPIL